MQDLSYKTHRIYFEHHELGRVGFLDFNTGKMVFDGDMHESAKIFFDLLSSKWGTRNTEMLAADKQGMLIDYQGMLNQAAEALERSREKALAFMLQQFKQHLSQAGKAFYKQDLPTVDEFLQLYCVAQEGRVALKAKEQA
ncbi:hypothetical protein [Parvibium lacunae]|uniref:Uncharacterized protein n=1 Tax=Parvibium lacunae TaxID=1888893 RepID=A0A368L807_9BURK|nr:hypothetical protein [Parvibium lacunae]RCS59747.1 hypothetical protein DU000_03295 [Parvibium lacunae]